MELESESIFVTSDSDTPLVSSSCLVQIVEQEEGSTSRIDESVQTPTTTTRVAVASSGRRRLRKSPIVMTSQKVEALIEKFKGVGSDQDLEAGAKGGSSRVKSRLFTTPSPVVVDERRPKLPGASSYEEFFSFPHREGSRVPGVAIDPRKSPVGNKVRAMLRQLRKKRNLPAQEPSLAKWAEASDSADRDEEAMATPPSPRQYDPVLSGVTTPSRKSNPVGVRTTGTPSSGGSPSGRDRKSQMMDVSLALDEISEAYDLEESCSTLQHLQERLESRLAQEPQR